MARSNVEVGGPQKPPSLRSPDRPTEQKKAALRRVEMELDEADEMVRLLCFRSRYPYPDRKSVV